jgi:hypothetical protein
VQAFIATLRQLCGKNDSKHPLSELTAQSRDRGCFLDLEAVIRKFEVKNDGHCA